MLKNLIQFTAMFHFYTSPKTSKNLRFSDVFKGYRNGALGFNGLKSS